MEIYDIQRKDIDCEALHNEVIVINFKTGNYYVLVHIAKHVWQLLEQHIPLSEIAELFSNQYRLDKTQVESDIRQFIAQLVSEELIKKTENIFPKESPISIDVPGWEYNRPKLVKYTDVQDLLLLDPIHEVAETGWPERK